MMSIGTRAMTAAYAQLTTSSNNIANANTPGYSRQQVVLAATEGQFTGSGYFGRGVTVQTVTRASDAFLTQQASATGATAAADAARSDLLRQLEKVFGTGDSGLGVVATEVFNAWSDLAAAPADLSARESVLARMQDFAALSRSDADRLAALQVNVVQDIHNTVGVVNQMLTDVAGLNRRIADAHGNGQSPNDLLDQRDALVAKIGQAIEVTTIAAPDGSLSVFTAAGQSLVLGNGANALVAQVDTYDPARVAVGLKVGTEVTPIDAHALGGGSIAGALAFQNTDLVEARDRLGQLVAAFAGTLNQQQSLGIDLTGQPGSALFQLAAPAALPASANATAGGHFVASVSLAVTDPAALEASEYLLAGDPAHAGRYTVTRLSDGLVRSNVASGDLIDGFSITIGTPLAASDRFLLQPVGGAAGGVQAVLGNPRALAAASPLTAAAASANAGSASIVSLAITAAPTAPYQRLSLNFIDAAGGWELRDTAGTVEASGTLVAGQPIAFNGFALALTSAPAQGDKFDIAPTAHAGANNGNALAIDALAAAHLVGGNSVTDAYAQLLAAMGTRSAGAIAASRTSAQVADASRTALTSKVGVNIDEEAARLMQYQQSYQAAAKILQTAQTVLEALIQLGN